VNVETPATLKSSKSVSPSTSRFTKSPVVAVTTPVIFAPPVPFINFPSRSRLPPSCGVVSSTTLLRPEFDAVTVTTPAEIADTSKFVEKLIVLAVPTAEPSCLITTPDPDPVTPVNPDPSPTKVVAVTTPVILIPPEVIVDPVPTSSPFFTLKFSAATGSLSPVVY